MVDITGLDKAQVLAALFNASKQQGMGFCDPSGATSISVEDARLIVESGLRLGLPLDFDYLRGRVMKVDISKDSFNPSLYDRDVGQGAASRAIDALRV